MASTARWAATSRPGGYGNAIWWVKTLEKMGKSWKKWDKPEEFLEHLVKLWVKSGKHVIRKNEGKDVGTYGNMLGTCWEQIG